MQYAYVTITYYDGYQIIGRIHFSETLEQKTCSESTYLRDQTIPITAIGDTANEYRYPNYMPTKVFVIH